MELIKYEDALNQIKGISGRFVELLKENTDIGYECELVKKVGKHYTFYLMSDYSTLILYMDADEAEFGEKMINDYNFFDRQDDPGQNEFLENLLTRREAEQYAGLSAVAFQHHIRKENVKPCKDVGEGTGRVMLFWKKDLEKLK